MRINANVPALNSLSHIHQANVRISASTKRLSSGIRINSAKDDAAGLAISNKLSRQITGGTMAGRNVMNGISIMQSTDTSMGTIHNLLQRMRELSVQAATDSMVTEDREKLNLEVDQLIEELNDTAKKSEYNRIKLLGGEGIQHIGNKDPIPYDLGTSAASNINDLIIKIQAGSNKDLFMEVSIPAVNSTVLNLDNIDFKTADNARNAIDVIDDAISTISTSRAVIGAYQNRLEKTASNLELINSTMELSLSRIYDTDMAKEMTLYTKDQILSQAGVSVLAQANQRPQLILQLLN